MQITLTTQWYDKNSTFKNWAKNWKDLSQGKTYENKKVKVVSQLCPTLCDPIDCSPPGSSVLGILQARILEWVAISFSRGSSQPRDWTHVSHFAGRFFTIRTTREDPRPTIWRSNYLIGLITWVNYLISWDLSYFLGIIGIKIIVISF